MSDLNPFVIICQRLARGTPEERFATVGDIAKRYGDHLERLARQRIGRRLKIYKGASGIVNSVCLNLLCRDLSNFKCESEEELLAYLKTMIDNKIIDGEKEEQAQKRGSGKAPISLAAADSAGPTYEIEDRSAKTPSSQIRKKEQEMLVRKFCDSLKQALDASEFELLTKFYVEGQSQADLAESLGSTPDAIRMRLQRIRERLNKKLGIPEELLADD